MLVLASRLLLLLLPLAAHSSAAAPHTQPRALSSTRQLHAESHWETLPSLPLGPRQENSVAALGTDVYILAGITAAAPNATAFPSLQLVQAYSTESRTWRRVADVPTPLNHAHLAAVAGKLYVLGSLTGDGPFLPTGVSYKYDAGADAWTRLPKDGHMPEGSERGAGAVGSGGTANVSVFDTQTGTWLPAEGWPALPDGGRDHAGGAVVGDTMAGMPTPRGGLMAAAVDGKVYTFGGENDEALGAGPDGVYADVEVYDTETDCWEKLPDMAVPRHGTGAAVVAGRIFIPGGANMTGAGATSVFDAFSP
ncbi:kelch domain protein [Apiospora phragmitis]|uniref:Kelch domain protein n=1 Tax=Apiospora phragmitis TaxID=2905665 RepID=A0ABR1UTY6_9PEZI